MRGERKKGRRWAICFWKNLRVLAASRETNNRALAGREEAHAKARRREEGRGRRDEGREKEGEKLGDLHLEKPSRLGGFA